MQANSRSRWPGWAVIGMLSALCGCSRDDAARAPAATESQVVLGADGIAVVRRTELSRGPLISGALEARERATLVAEVGGSVLALEAELGDRVRRRQVLARIDPAGLRDRYRSALAAVRSAEQAFEVAELQARRTAALVERGALPVHELEVDQTEAAAAAARLAEARANATAAQNELERTVVRSPIDGVVSEQPAYAGDVVTAGAPLLTVIDPSSMRLEASVPSEHLPLLRRGARVEFEVRGQPGELFTGTITSVAPAADPATRQIAILVAIPNPSGELLEGLFAEGRIVGQQRVALAVPSEAIDRAGPEPTVTAIRDGKAERVMVTLGISDDLRQLVEVRSGLREGETVVTGPARALASGTRVELSRAAAAVRRAAREPEYGDGAD